MLEVLVPRIIHNPSQFDVIRTIMSSQTSFNPGFIIFEINQYSRRNCFQLFLAATQPRNFQSRYPRAAAWMPYLTSRRCFVLSVPQLSFVALEKRL
jgi:hypothetical protein